MEYFLIKKTDKTWTWDHKSFAKGFPFKQITLYNRDMIHFILIKKLNKSLKDIIKEYLVMEEDETDEDSDSSSAFESLLPKIELLRSILIGKYALYLSEYEIESYLIKFDKFEEKIAGKSNRKNFRR